MNNDIKIQFLGGVEEVGRLAMVLETSNIKLLFEYGMSPGKPPEYPMPAPFVDTVFLTGLLFKWNTFRTSATMMDCTTVVVWPDNAGSWIYPYEYSQGEFDASNRWYSDAWPDGLVTYSMGLRYK